MKTWKTYSAFSMKTLIPTFTSCPRCGLPVLLPNRVILQKIPIPSLCIGCVKHRVNDFALSAGVCSSGQTMDYTEIVIILSRLKRHFSTISTTYLLMDTRTSSLLLVTTT